LLVTPHELIAFVADPPRLLDQVGHRSGALARILNVTVVRGQRLGVEDRVIVGYVTVRALGARRILQLEVLGERLDARSRPLTERRHHP
jgi:hypothetical protein